MAARLFNDGILGSSRMLAISAFSAGLWRGRTTASHLCVRFIFCVPAAKIQRNESLIAVSGPTRCHQIEFLSVNSDRSLSVLRAGAPRIFSGRRCDEFGIDKDAINTGA
jgi:hypothetical protein